MLTVAQHVAHVGQTNDWFIEGMMSPNGFDLDFENHWKLIQSVTSLATAREWFTKSIVGAKETVANMSEQELISPLPEGPVMGGQPKLTVISGISDHSAHHRGALTVYSRLIGYEPSMPYGA